MATPEAQLQLVVGLGNPGSEYAGTRHNVGFALLDRMGRTWRWQERDSALWAEAVVAGNTVVFCKPLTYMNRSGDAVGPYVRFRKIALAQVLVVQDELDLPLGELRLKQSGGDGGHNGLKSLTAALGGSDYLRLRLGIGRPPAAWSLGRSGADGDDPVVSWVLGRFSKDELSLVDSMLEAAEASVKRIVEVGFERAQNSGNRRLSRDRANMDKE